MANIFSTPQIAQRLIEFIRAAKPNLTLNPGSVARDLFVDMISIRFAELYNELQKVSSSQSISKSVGQDLENLASNYTVPRLAPGKSSGNAILTFNSITADIPVPSGSLIYARNGLSFKVLTGFVILASSESQYKALAATYNKELENAGITDQYCAEVLVECSSTGTQGNIAKFNLVSTSIAGISNVTNIEPFTGGTASESDSSYKTRLLSVFSGSNTGTALGYQSIISANPYVISAYVATPGSPLMTRDNTILKRKPNGDYYLDENNDPVILSEGSGGKVDIFVYGRRVVETLDSYIYNDLSGTGDATDEANDFILGQIIGDEGKTVTRRRLENIANGTLPSQPVLGISEVIGSRSGVLSPQIIDEYGVSTGNYTLVSDTGAFAKSCFGADKLRWVSNSVTRTEDVSKGKNNGQDTLLYSDAISIDNIKRTIFVTNENSLVNENNRSEIYLAHKPVRSVNRVLNVTTGERYVVANRNPDGENTASLNTTGKIVISGKNLPATSDTLQIDYEWEFSHDPYIDYDSFLFNDNPRAAIDAVDWGYNNAIRREEKVVSDGYSIIVEHNISSVVSVNKLTTESATVTLSTSLDKLVISGLSNIVQNVVSIRKKSGLILQAEVYNTSKKDGSFDGNMIVLPTDTSAQSGDTVEVYYNAVDLFTISGVSGNFSGKTIYLNAGAKDLIHLGDYVEANYIADISELIPTTNLSSLPIYRSNNQFITSLTPTGFGVQPCTNDFVGSLPVANLRKSPTKLAVNVAGTSSPGVLTFAGKSYTLLRNVLVKCVSSGLTQDLSLAIKTGLGISLTTALSATVSLANIASIEKVEVNSGVVTSVLNKFDIIGGSIHDNKYAIDLLVADNSLSVTEFKLPLTTDNVENQLYVGDYIRVSLYVEDTAATEEISFSTNGTLYTNTTFSYIEAVTISSGFKSTSNFVGSLSVYAMNQPAIGGRYRAEYSYTAPKSGERISVRFNFNALIGDLTLSLEEDRPITADVLIKSTSPIYIDISARISILKEFKTSKTLVAQNIADKIASSISGLPLGATLNPSDIVNIAYQVSGLDSITITRFNKSDVVGVASFIAAMKNEYMQASNISILIA